jgi:hypothetical protein
MDDRLTTPDVAAARGHEKILVDGQLSPGSRTAEILLGGQVISVSAL